jgi:phage protein D
MGGDLYYHVTVTAGGTAFDLSHDLTSLSIDEEGGKPDQLNVELSDPYKVLGHALQEGMEVEADIGATDDHSIIFRGRIYRVESDLPAQGVPTLKFIAYDKSMAMGLRQRNRAFTGVTLSELVIQVAEDYFDNIEVELVGDPSFTGNGIRQQDETDLAFLLRLAHRYGAEMYVLTEDDGETFYFTAQRAIMESDPEVSLYHGRCDAAARLISFQASGDVSDIQLPRVFSGIDYATGEPTEATTADVEDAGDTEDAFFDENMAAFGAAEPDRADRLQELLAAAPQIQQNLRDELGGVEREPTPGFVSQEDLNMRAENRFSTSVHGMRGNGTCLGNHRLCAQANVRIEDVGGRFSGLWYLSQVRHVLDRRGYQVEIQCQR